jgi:hypothetical protein
MKSVEPPAGPPEGQWRPSQVVDAHPSSSAHGPIHPQGGGNDSLSNSLSSKDSTRVFLHQLSQNLTSLCGTLELALLIPSDEHEYRRAIRQSLAQAEGLVQLFRSYRATTDAGTETTELMDGRVGLVELVRVALEQSRPLADSRRVTLHMESRDDCVVQTDLTRVLMALRQGLRCAIQQSPAGGMLEVTISSKANSACLTISAKTQSAASLSHAAFSSIREHDCTRRLATEIVDGDWTPARHAVELLGGSVLTIRTEASPLICEICIPLSQP